jgi:pyruvate kinase
LNTTETDVLCRVRSGGLLESRKGVNLPGLELDLESPTEKDLHDLYLGLELGVDYIALSFVRSYRDIVELRRVMQERGSDIPIVAKIEKREAVADLEAVVREADAVMVARGDLGVEMDLEEIPLLQKRIIAVAARQGKPVPPPRCCRA